MDVVARHNITQSGQADGQPMVFVHGFGCDQHMWRFVAPDFEDRFRVVNFDYAGAGGADPSAYDPERHETLHGYAEDLVAICRELGLRDVVLVAHSVSAMVGALADRLAPDLFAKIVMVGPSPRYIDDEDYRGGFSESDIHELLDSLDSNYLGWSSAMAPVIMGNPDRPELGQELTTSFCRTDPDVARRFARATFLSDYRSVLPEVETPTLVLQCTQDAIAPVEVGQYVADHLPNARLRMLEATGHCPNLSAPEQTSRAIDEFVR